MKLAFESDYKYFKNGCFNCGIDRCFELQKLYQYYKKLYLNETITRIKFLCLTSEFVDELYEIKRSCDKLEMGVNDDG